MANDIVVTLDFFLRDWNDAANGELWICVQPHVVESTGATLADWIRGSAKGTNCTYRMASPSFSDALIPVNFNDDVNVSLDVVHGGTTTRITNDRRAGIRVRDAAAAAEIARVNREPRDDRSTANQAGQQLDVDIVPGPFAFGYNASLRAALAAQTDPLNPDKLEPDHFRQMLEVAFWGGTRRYLPTSAVDVGKVALMRLPESDASLLVTNLHGLCGLLFRIGTRADLGSLQTITDLRVVLDDSTQLLAVANHDQNAIDSIHAFFSKLPATIQLPVPPFAEWEPSAASRVYAIENFASLTHEPRLGAGPWYRRQTEAAASAPRRLLSKLQRLAVRFDTHYPTAAPLPAWPQLHWEVWDAFDVTLTPYRRFAASRSKTNSAPLHLQPSAVDRKRFHAELQANPQLFTGGGIRLVDETGTDQAPRLQFIGTFDFPWDRAAGELAPAACLENSDRTVLLHGPTGIRETLTLLVRRGVVLETTRIGDNDSFGPRWELANAPVLPPVHFTHLLCTDLPDAGSAARLTPAVAFERDLRFEFAQAASSIEGKLTATFPHGTGAALTRPDEVDPVDEYIHDLVNHNAVNAYALWDGKPLEVDAGPQPGRKPGHLNPYGQLYPTAKTGNVKYEIPFRHRLTPTVPPPDRSPRSIRLFFRDIYARIGASRSVTFDFEHTYGTQLALPIDGNGPAVAGLSSHYDFDLVTPPEVTRTGEPGAGCSPTQASDFMTVTYQRIAGREVLRLTLHTKWLRSEYAVCGNGSMRTTHIAAWRAVAELAYAGGVHVSGLFRRFDFQTALASCETDGIAAGLTPVPAFENREWLVPPASLSQPCRELLDLDAFPDEHTFEIVLTEEAENPKVFESCNVIEIFLTTTRDASRLARKQGWSFVRPRPQVRGAGEGFEPLDPTASAEANESFHSYLDSIAKKRAVLRPALSDQQAKEAERFRRLLGNGIGRGDNATARRQADPGAWILPEGIAAAAEGSVVPSVCPLTFRAPALDPLLGPLTFELLRKYFRLLQVVIDCDFHDAIEYTETQWREHFALLDDAARALSDPESLFDAVLDSVLAVPDPDPAAGIDAEVRELALALRDPVTPAAMALRRWLAHQLWREPALFGDAKALLFHRLRPAAGAMTPPDFFSLESTREITEAQQNETAAATFRQSLVDLAPTPWFGIAEVLDDVRYDNDFTFAGYRLRSFEGIVSDPEAAPAPNARPEVPVAGRLLHVPAGAQHLDQPATAKLVRLASRAPVIPPAHVFSGAIGELQRGPALARLRNVRLSLDALKRGSLLAATAGQPAVRLAGATPDLAVAPRLDQYVLSTMFAIHGDEETANAWRSAFDNDEIRIHLRRGAGEEVPKAFADAASNDVAELFSAIAEASHMHQARVAPKLVVSPDTMAFVTRILRTRSEAAPTGDAPALTITHRIGGGDCVDLALKFAAGEPLSGRVQAFLFAASPENLAPCDESAPRTTFILMIDVLVPVWDRTAVGIVQLRNARHGFAPELAQTTQVVLPERFHQPFLTAPGPALTLPRRPHSIAELVDAFAFADPNAAKQHDISVTVSHLQLRTFPAATGPQQPANVAQASAFPLSNPRKSTKSVQDVEFDPDYDDFLLDVQWSSATNLQFFRVTECRVRVT